MFLLFFSSLERNWSLRAKVDLSRKRSILNVWKASATFTILSLLQCNDEHKTSLFFFIYWNEKLKEEKALLLLLLLLLFLFGLVVVKCCCEWLWTVWESQQAVVTSNASKTFAFEKLLATKPICCASFEPMSLIINAEISLQQCFSTAVIIFGTSLLFKWCLGWFKAKHMKHRFSSLSHVLQRYCSKSWGWKRHFLQWLAAGS